MHVAVVGSGKMGSAIFRALTGSSIEAATLYSRREETGREQERKFLKGLERARRQGGMTEAEFRSKRDSCRFTDRLADLAGADLVIEAVPEDFELKVALFGELESIVGRETVLTTNSSVISMEKLARRLKHPERFCGLHFFHPVMLIALVEIIRWGGTSGQAIDRVLALCERTARKPIVVPDAPGSVINTILAYHYVEALYILDEGGALPSKVDEAARRFFYLGPCESIDVVGVDFFAKLLETFLELFAPRTAGSGAQVPTAPGGVRKSFHEPHLLSALLASERLGKRASQGIYRYENATPLDEPPEFYAAPGRAGKSPSPTDEWLGERLLFSILNGTLDAWMRTKASWSDLDIGIKEVLLMKEGPFTIMRSMGEEVLRTKFELLAERAGQRFTQTAFPFFESEG
jgi:3-hydroxyacyl-CoA dehydrogenase